jgi:hypothetical protein
VIHLWFFSSIKRPLIFTDSVNEIPIKLLLKESNSIQIEIHSSIEIIKARKPALNSRKESKILQNEMNWTPNPFNLTSNPCFPRDAYLIFM